MEQIFQDFLDNIEPTSIQKENMVTAIHNLSSFFKNETQLKIKAIVPFGSYSKKTNIRPLNDVDVIVVFESEDYIDSWRFWNPFIPPKGQSMLTKLRYHLKNNPNYTQTEIFQDKPTVVVNLSTIKIELIPCFVYDGRILIPNPIKRWYNNEWISTDTIEFETKLNEANEINNERLIPLIKMLKVWRRNFDLSDNLMMSLGIEETTRDVFNKNNVIQDFPSALVEWFGHIRNNSRNNKLTIGGLIGFFLKKGAGLLWGIALGYVIDYFSRPEIWPTIDYCYRLSKEARDFAFNGQIQEAHQKYKKLFGREFPAMEN